MDQPRDCTLSGAFRDAHRFSEVAIADTHGFIQPLLFRSKPQIHEVAHRSAVMPDKIAHQAVENVFIKLNHAIPSVNIAILHTLHNRVGGAILRLFVSEDYHDDSCNRHCHHSST